MKRFLLASLVVLGLFVFVAAAGAQKKVKLEVWDWQPGENYMSAMAENMDLFKKAHPEVTFDHVVQGKDYWTALKTALVSGKIPDVFGILRSNVDLYGYMEDLKPIIAKDKEWMAQQDYVDSPDIWTGKMLVSIALDEWVAGVYYYKDMLKKYNLKEPVTIDDYVAMVPVLARDNIKVIAQGGDWWVMEWFFYNLAQQYAGDTVNVSHDTELGKYKWTDPWFKQALTAMKKLYDGGVYREDELQLGQFAEAIQNFQNRKSWGFWMGGTWWAGSMNAEDLKNNNVGILPVPLIDKKGALTFSKSTGQPYGLPKKIAADKRSTAIAFLKFLSSPDAVGVLLKNNILPAAKVPKGMTITNSLINETVMKGNKIRGYNFRPLNGEISQTVGDQLTSCLLGQISVDDALAKIEQVQRTLKY